MAILITGGCGFLGSHLVDQMVAEGCSVLVFDRVYKKELWDEYGWSQNPMVSFMLGDIKAVSYTHLTLPTKRIV